MDDCVKKPLDEHEDYQRLAEMFPLEFVVECTTNSRRKMPELAVGKILEANGENPSLFIAQVLYHTRVELERFRELGYTDSELGAPSYENPEFPEVNTRAKRKELLFLRQIGEKVLEIKLPFLSMVFAAPSPGEDYGIQTPPYESFLEMIDLRIRGGMNEYKEHFALGDVESAIRLYKIGGDPCSGEQQSLNLARRYIAKGQSPLQPWIIA